MLTLVEPCIMDGLLDRPHLGCAMLIAACQEKGIKTTLVKGQTRYLRDMFINDSEELWGLIQDLKENDLEKIGIANYKKSIQKKGIRQFRDELKSLYQYAVIDKNPRHYFNIQIVEKFNNFHNTFIAVYFYYLTNLNYNKLKIVDHYISEIVKSNPRYIGFSLQGSFEALSRIIRKRIKELTNIPIIVGGALTPFIDFKKMDKTFEEEYLDYLVIGAGEHALPSLIEAIDNKKEPKGIINVFYKKDSKIKGNDLGVIDDLDSLPYPDYSQFDLDLYRTPERILPLQTARGCSWRKCAFCSHHSIDFGNYKTFSIEKVIETIKYLQHAYNCRNFYIHDEELPPARAKRISEAILDTELDNLSFETRARLVKGYNDDELLHYMYKAGFTLIIWGLESGCQRILDLMNKGTEISTISQIFKKSSKNKIYNICYVILGFPGETKEETQQTVEFLEKYAAYIDFVQVACFKLNSFSPIGKNPERWGVDIKEDSAYSTKNGISRQELDAFYQKFLAKFSANIIRVTSDRLKYSPSGHDGSTLFFLNSRHKILSNTTLLGYLKKGKLNNIFPIILGEIKKKNSRIIFYPINIRESKFINQIRPEKGKILDEFEEKIFILSDGTLSIGDISFIIYNDFKAHCGEEYIYKKSIDFFQEIFSKNWGLGFAKSWNASYNKNI